MAYTKTTWQDEVLDGAERFEVLDNAGAAVDAWADLENCQIQLATTVTTTGTAINASNLNNMESGIETANDFIDKIHRGRVSSAGVAIELPSGWTCTRNSAGHYVITHNLGTTDYTAIVSQEFTGILAFVGGIIKTTNNFSIHVKDSDGFGVDRNVHFILIED
jgi:hypothetical protein